MNWKKWTEWIALLAICIIAVMFTLMLYKDWHKTDGLGGFSISADKQDSKNDEGLFSTAGFLGAITIIVICSCCSLSFYLIYELLIKSVHHLNKGDLCAKAASICRP